MKILFATTSSVLTFSITDKVDDGKIFNDLVQPRYPISCGKCECPSWLFTNSWSDCQTICNIVNNCAAWTWDRDRKECIQYHTHTGFAVFPDRYYAGLKGDFVMIGYHETAGTAGVITNCGT